MSDVGPSATVMDFVAEITGAEVKHVRPVGGGVSRISWVAQLQGGSRSEVYVRAAGHEQGPVAQTFGVAREARLIQIVTEHGVPAPTVLGIDDRLQVAVMELVPGQSDFDSIRSETTQKRLIGQYSRALRTLHGLDAVIADDGSPATTESAVRHDLAQWRSFLDASADAPDPLGALAVRWLSESYEATSESPSIVHGDAGPGNFLFQGGRLMAMLDWELWHVGDPVEDLGWILLRAWKQPAALVGSWIAQFLRLHQRAARLPSLHFGRIAALAKTSIAISVSLEAGRENRVVTHAALGAFYRKILTHALADALNVELVDPPWPASAEGASLRDRVYRELATALKSMEEAPSTRRPMRAQARHVGAAVEYLARDEALRSALNAEIAVQCRRLTGVNEDDPGRALRLMCVSAETADRRQMPELLQAINRIETLRLLAWPRTHFRARSAIHQLSTLLAEVEL